MNHSPAPWVTDESTRHAIIFDLLDKIVCTIPIQSFESLTPTQMINAKLIAAAPDLFAALKEMQAALTRYRLHDVKKYYSLCVADAAASKAIAKAEGA